jgi:hypothetical protein
MNKLKLFTLTIFCITILSCKNNNDKNIVSKDSLTAESTIIISSEVNKFWDNFNENDTIKRNHLLVNYVLDSVNNPGVNAMYQMTLNDTVAFTERITKYGNYYKSMQNQSIDMVNKKYPKMDAYYTAFKKMYPKAHRPNIIFTVGAMTAGGTITNDGLVIGTEFYGKKSADTTGMGRVGKFLLNPDDFVPLTFHEQMHFEQIKIAGGKDKFIENTSGTLLSNSLKEGAADFVSNLVTGWNNNRPNYIYGSEHEKELWQKFQKEMFSNETLTNWMYDYRIEKDTPTDLGYFIGAKICESYYNNATDKSKAIEDILSIMDAKKFLIESKYDKKFMD